MMFSHNERFVLFFCSCHCDRYVSAEELCNSSCVSTLPVLSARLDTDGQLLLRIKAADESKAWSRVRSGPVKKTIHCYVSVIILCLLMWTHTKNNIVSFFSQNMINVLGPDVHVKNIGKIHFVQFAPEGVFGWILKDPVLIDSLVRGKLPVFIWPPDSNILPKSFIKIIQNIKL